MPLSPGAWNTPVAILDIVRRGFHIDINTCGSKQKPKVKKKVLIFGGSGTIGNALVEEYKDIWDITVFSRDEFKQAVMRQAYPQVHYLLGDVRDRHAVRRAICQSMPSSFIYAAAMKRVEMCEEQPSQAVLTNIIGATNVAEEASALGVMTGIFITTDKGVEPVNTYGMTKAIQEKVATQFGYNCSRYGNVWASRGSVVPLFLEQKAEGKPLTITDTDMTRFILTKADAIKLIVTAMTAPMDGSIYVKPSPSAYVLDIALAIDDKLLPKCIGRGRGEKIHECLISHEEVGRTSYHRNKDGYDYYVIHRDFPKPGHNFDIPTFDSYNSYDNPDKLTVEDIKCLVLNTNGTMNTKSKQS
jgi:UDP-N-acetylglucosamine 4,6-dehydratase